MYSITKFGDSISNMGIRQFLADNISDIDKLPHITSKGEQQGNNTSSNAMISAGSKCLCIENSSWYILGNDDIWHKISNTNIDASAISMELDENGVLYFTTSQTDES